MLSEISQAQKDKLCMFSFICGSEKLKQLNGISINERIAVILFAGYYDEKSFVTVSPRRSVDDVLKINT